MEKIGSREARTQFADMLNRAAFLKDRIVVTKNGKDVAALVPIEDLRALEHMEDQIDIAAARKIMAAPKLRNWDDVKKELVETQPAARARLPRHGK